MPGPEDTRPLGLIVPAVNHILQTELVAWLGPAHGCEVRRIPPRGRPGGVLLPEDMPEYGAKALALADTFGPAQRTVVYGCTAGGFLAGRDAEARLLDEMRRRTGKPCVGTAHAVAAALGRAGVSRLAVITPYADAMNDALGRYLGEFGIQVVDWQKLDLPRDAPVADATRELERLAGLTRRSGCDGLFIACSLVPAFAAVRNLRNTLGLPVCSSGSATADAVARLAA